MKKVLIWGALVAVAAYFAYTYWKKSKKAGDEIINNPSLMDALTTKPITGGVMMEHPISTKDQKMNP